MTNEKWFCWHTPGLHSLLFVFLIRYITVKLKIGQTNGGRLWHRYANSFSLKEGKLYISELVKSSLHHFHLAVLPAKPSLKDMTPGLIITGRDLKRNGLKTEKEPEAPLLFPPYIGSPQIRQHPIKCFYCTVHERKGNYRSSALSPTAATIDLYH
jgi:hypothetical protein